MKHPRIHAHIEPRGGFRVALVLRNPTDVEAHLYLPNACAGGRIENDVFRVRDGHKEAAYTGRYVKRPAPRPEDFASLPAHDTRTEEVDLATAYAVVPGTTYSVTYEAFHGSPTNPDDLWEVVSPPLAIAGGTK